MLTSNGGDYAARKSHQDTLGSVIKSARLEKQLTRKELSKTLGITPRYLAGIENENLTPSFQILARIVHELNVPPETVFAGD
jgi:Predicted transcriptional regulators